MLDRTHPAGLPQQLNRATAPIRVCHLVSTAAGGTWHLEQLSELRTRYGYDTSSVINAGEGPLGARLDAAGIPHLAFDFSPAMVPPLWDLVGKVYRLAQHFRRERIDIIQTSLWHAQFIGRLAGWLADVPVRLHMAAGTFHQEAPITKWIDRDTCWMDTAIIGGCEYIRDLYLDFGLANDRLRVVYFGPDERRFEPDRMVAHDLRQEFGWPEDTPVIAHVAWFYARVADNRWAPPHVAGNAIKGHEDLIRATPEITANFPGAKVVLIGGGWLEDGQRFMDEMQDLVVELGLQESVIFLGARPNVNEILKTVDVAVQPSLNECCGGTLEALLMKCPTVGTRVGGIPEIIVDGKTGVLVEPENPSDLARGICSLLADRDFGRRLGETGRGYVLERATLSTTVSDLDRVYREFLFQNGRRKEGHRSWLSVLRLPIIVLVCAYIRWRLTRVEYHYLPMWNAGWRPWHLDSLREIPNAIWNRPGIFLLRYHINRAVAIARGHGYGLLQRAWCRYCVFVGTLQSYRLRLLCWTYRVRGHGISLYHRAIAACYRMVGYGKSYRQRFVCWAYLVRGHGSTLYHRAIGSSYRLAGYARSYRQQLVCEAYKSARHVKIACQRVHRGAQGLVAQLLRNRRPG